MLHALLPFGAVHSGSRILRDTRVVLRLGRLGKRLQVAVAAGSLATVLGQDADLRARVKRVLLARDDLLLQVVVVVVGGHGCGVVAILIKPRAL